MALVAAGGGWWRAEGGHVEALTPLRGLHWEALDEDIAIDGLLAGHGDLTHGRLVTPA